MIGQIVIISSGLFFVAAFFPWMRWHDTRRQRKQIDEGKPQTSLMRSSDRALPAISYAAGSFVVSLFFSIILAIVTGLILLSTVLAWIVHIQRKNRRENTDAGR